MGFLTRFSNEKLVIKMMNVVGRGGGGGGGGADGRPLGGRAGGRQQLVSGA